MMINFQKLTSVLLLIIALYSCNEKSTTASKPVKLETNQNDKEKSASENQNAFEDIEENWNPDNEKKCKEALKNNLIRKGYKEELANLFAECAISKMKVQNLKPTDVRKSENSEKLLSISVSCANEIEKK